MKLQILISQYDKETNDVVKPLLDSLAIQQNVDLENEIGVIIVNDGSDTMLDEEWLGSYPFAVQYIKTEHGGVGAARNAALDAAEAEYVMFCDADDMFFNACGLWMIFNEIANGGFDVLTSNFVEEIRQQGTNLPQYVNHENDCTFIHGKILRRAFLINHNIRWNETIECHGDSYFNCLSIRLAQTSKHCPSPFYLWKWRDESVCRSEKTYMLRTYNDFLNSSAALTRQFLVRGYRQDAEFYGVNTLFDMYYTLMKPEWLDPENTLYRAATMIRCRDFWEEFKGLLTTVDQGVLFQIKKGTREKFFNECGMLEAYTFDDWIRKLGEKPGEKEEETS